MPISEATYRHVVNLHKSNEPEGPCAAIPVVSFKLLCLPALHGNVASKLATPKQVAKKFPFASWRLRLMSVGKVMLPLPSVVMMMLRFMAMLGLWGYTSERCVQLVAEHRRVIVVSFCVVIFA